MDRVLRNELFVRLLAIALAVLVYIMAKGTGGTETRVVSNVPVQATAPTGYQVTNVQPSTVSLTVSGSAAAVNKLDVAGLVALVNLGAAQSGTQQYYVTSTAPTGVTVTAVNPASVHVTVDAVVAFNFPVVVKVSGTPADGFAVGPKSGIQVAPKLVVVQGVSQAVQAVVSVVAPVSVQGANQTEQLVAQPVAVDAAGQQVQGVTVSQQNVTVTVPIQAAQPSVTLPVSVQVTGQPPSGYSVGTVTADPSTVTVVGPTSALSGLKAVDTEPVSVATAKRDLHQTVLLVQPPGVTAVQPSQVAVTIPVARAKA